MQNIKKTLKSKRFWLGTVLPFALAVAAAFVARYQLEISDGVTANYMAGQWPVYAPLNACPSSSEVIIYFPDAWLNPASNAFGCPKFLAKLIPMILPFSFESRLINPFVLSFELSLTRIISYSNPSLFFIAASISLITPSRFFSEQ